MGAEPARLGLVLDEQAVVLQWPARADDEVPDLGVAHGAVRQPDRAAGCGQSGHQAGRPEEVKRGGTGRGDGVGRTRWRNAPAIENEQDAGGHRPTLDVRRSSSFCQKSGKDFTTQPGLRMTTPGVRSPATAKHMAMRWSS